MVSSLYDIMNNGKDHEDLAWAFARVAFAVGLPGARVPYDLVEVQAAVDAALHFHDALQTEYYRIGDSTWTKLIVVGLFPAIPGDTTGDRALLMPKPEGRSAYERAAPGDPWCLLDGRKVPWPTFEPPRVRLLTSSDGADIDASGFVAVERARPGDTRMKPDVALRPGA